MLNLNPIIVSDGIAMSNSVYSPKYYPTSTPEWRDPADYNSDEYLDLEPSTEDDYFDLEEPNEKQPKVKTPEALPSLLEVRSLKQKQPEETLAKDIPNTSSEPTISKDEFFDYNNQRVNVWNFEENLKEEMKNCQDNKELEVEGIKQNVYKSVKEAIDGAVLKEQDVIVERGVEVKTRGNKKRRKVNQGKSANKKPAKGTTGGYKGKHPLCNRCGKHHPGRCSVECQRCKKKGHLTKDCIVRISATDTPAIEANTTTLIRHKSGEVGHYKNNCPNEETKKPPSLPN